ncbi:RNA-binding protein [Gloeobacter kilaueensis JS1]|uniref:RNA-binding protein n=2 Tax=Gloeobacter TaxID=33071 RepID=U5QJC1_GLOK1|nr:RNA-binding protein [Gloeobacter kilaueensis JS1]
MTIYVGNLSTSVTEKAIESLFRGYGVLEQLMLPREQETGRAHGYAFVNLNNGEDEEKAVRLLDATEWMGRCLYVVKATPRISIKLRQDNAS